MLLLQPFLIGKLPQEPVAEGCDIVGVAPLAGYGQLIADPAGQPLLKRHD